MKPVTHIICDLGNVLIDIDIPKTVGEIAALAQCPPEEAAGIIASPIHLKFNTGGCSWEQFHDGICEHLNYEIPREDFRKAWLSTIGLTKAGIPALLSEANQRYQVAICSNTDPLHWQQALDLNPVLSEISPAYLSFAMGVRKPHSGIFEMILEDLEIDPGQCLFIDDTLDNIRSAAGLGFRTLHSADPADMRRHLENLEI